MSALDSLTLALLCLVWLLLICAPIAWLIYRAVMLVGDRTIGARLRRQRAELEADDERMVWCDCGDGIGINANACSCSTCSIQVEGEAEKAVALRAYRVVGVFSGDVLLRVLPVHEEVELASLGAGEQVGACTLRDVVEHWGSAR